MKTSSPWDAVIVGAGPAGLAAALMLGRARRRILVIDAGSPRNRFASHMHGVVGLEGVSPQEFRARGRAEAATYGVQFLDGAVDRVEHTTDGLLITTAQGEQHAARALVAAAGIRDELPDIAGLAQRWGSTVLHCPYCHGWEVNDQHLGVLTTSPMSLHQAELVRQWSDRITVFTAGLGEVSADTERRLRSRGIVLESTPVTEILGDAPAISGVRLADGREIAVDAIFTGGTPRAHDSFLAPLDLARTETPFGAFISVDTMGRTSDERVWAAGNLTSPAANVPLSSGSGTMAGAAVNAALVSWDFDAA